MFLCVCHFSISMTNAWNYQSLNVKGFFWVLVLETLVHDQCSHPEHVERLVEALCVTKGEEGWTHPLVA